MLTRAEPDMLSTVSERLVRILSWQIFFTVHLLLAAIVLVAIWACRVTPHAVAIAWAHWCRMTFGTPSGTGFGLLFLAVLVLLIAYAKVWKWGLTKALSAFLWHGISEHRSPVPPGVADEPPPPPRTQAPAKPTE